MIFVDSSAWSAAFVHADPDRQRARSWLRQNFQRLLTTDYIIDETLTVIRARSHLNRAIRVGQKLFDQAFVTIEWVTPDDVRRAWNVFRNYRDKHWSFTDCISRVVMERLDIKQAFAFDDDFRQFGTVTVVP